MRKLSSIWPWGVAAVAALPLLPAVSTSRIFYIRDLSLNFWPRYVWLRRTLLSGVWPLWDPYMGGGQSAVADGLLQMFFPPAMLLRLVGPETLGFNLWVGLPLPIAALGAWLFFARRRSAAASAVGALTFALSGPIVSAIDFPNMSWSVAALPWVLWAADRAATTPTRRNAALVALCVALQALAGEPVTLLATLAVAAAFALVVAPPTGDPIVSRDRLRGLVAAGGGILLGILAAAIQLLPMQRASVASERAAVVTARITRDLWSMHPLALLETIFPHLFGDYYTSASLAVVPWMPLVNSGREPFFFSIYVGVPVLALAVFGVAARPKERWTRFWAAAGAVSLLFAFFRYTPVYGFLRDHLPLLGSFRFPVKYLVVSSIVVAAMAASGWDALASNASDPERSSSAPRAAVAFAGGIALVSAVAVAACLYLATPSAFRFFAIAKSLGAADPVAAAAFMLRNLPPSATIVMLIAIVVAVLFHLAASVRSGSSWARVALGVVIAVDLVVRAWGVNPVFDAAYAAPPDWLSRIDASGGWRFYFGGKGDGTLDANDIDASRGYLTPPGLGGSAARAVLNSEVVFYPSAWKAREMLSFDLPVLWPHTFDIVTRRFYDTGREGRDRFLDRTAVRYRILPVAAAPGRQPILKMPLTLESFLYDWGPGTPPRATVVADVRVVPEFSQQADALFAPGWDAKTTAIVERVFDAAGDSRPPVPAYARLADDGINHVRVEAGAPAGGGYLILLDSYADDWHATVDGRPAPIARANALFRAVRLAPGDHVIDFVFRPTMFYRGAIVTAIAVLILVLLTVAPARRRDDN